MKNLRISGVIFLTLIIMQACNSGSYKSAKVKTKADSASYMLGLSVGYSIQKQEIPDIDPGLIAKGIAEVLDGDTAVTEEEVNMFLSMYFRGLQEEKMNKNQIAAEDFLAENKKKEGVIETASGLQYKVIQEGTGASPKATDMVKCHYKGTLINGDVFDSSYDRGVPAEFSLQGVIPGWTEGLQLMKEGGKYLLYLPPNLGYGPRGAGGKIGPNSLLIFEIELLEVMPETKDKAKE